MLKILLFILFKYTPRDILNAPEIASFIFTIFIFSTESKPRLLFFIFTSSKFAEGPEM